MLRTLVLVALAVIALFHVASARAQGSPEVPEPPQGGPWKPPAPAPTVFDWVQLTSGEWLKGDIERLRDDVLRFDSDELDELDLDWEDVAQVRTARPHTYRFEEPEEGGFFERLFERNVPEPIIVTGIAQIDAQQVRIVVDGEARVYPRAWLVAMVPGTGEREIQYWTGKASVGAAVRSGNVDQADLTARLDLSRTTSLTRFILGYSGALGAVDDVRNVDSHTAGTSFDVFLTRRFFVRPAFADFFRDPFKNIDYRITPGTGLGYRIVDEKKLDVDVSVGAGYQKTGFVSIPRCSIGSSVAELYACVQQRSVPTDKAAFLAGLRFESEPTDRIDFDGSYRFQMSVPDTQDILHNLQLVLSVDVWGDLDLDVSLNWDRVEDPVANADGTKPKKDDVRLSVGFGWDF